VFGQVQRDGSFIRASPAYNDTLVNQSINKANATGVRQAENAAQFLIRGAQTISYNDDSSGCLASMLQDASRGLFDPLRDSRRHNEFMQSLLSSP
jgi:hypothetical protein